MAIQTQFEYIRVSPELKELLERAAKIKRLKRAQFIRQVVEDAANAVVMRHERKKQKLQKTH